MEKMLLKLARQLDSLDEASLMALWSKYATLASHFEPTKRWEEACLVFSLIQAKHWKNQLFNYSWSQQRVPPDKGSFPMAETEIDLNFGMKKNRQPAAKPGRPCRVLAFRQPQAMKIQLLEENDVPRKD